MSYWAVVPAAGAGRRMGRMGGARPKQYLRLGRRTVIEHALAGLCSCSRLAGVVVAVAPGDPWWARLALPPAWNVRSVVGGAERSDSVLNGLEALLPAAVEDDWVLVHDAARPCLAPRDVERLILEVGDHPIGGLLGVPLGDTLKRVRAGGVVESVDRAGLWRALTPQMFRLGALRAALTRAREAGVPVTDESMAIERFGTGDESCRPVMVEGSATNIKVTRPGDRELAETLLGAAAGRAGADPFPDA